MAEGIMPQEQAGGGAPQEAQQNPVEQIADLLGALADQLPPGLSERMAAVHQEFIDIANAASGNAPEGGAPQQSGAVPVDQGGVPAGPQGAV